MADADWEFVFDGVIGFLSSPIWQLPIMAYIEKNCIVFDPSEENCLSWLKLHKQYGSLVEDLLSSYLQDVGITEEQFFKACGADMIRDRPQMQLVFEQIWAAEDFEVFKRMMVQRNIELEIQALQLIQQRQGAQLPRQKKQEPERALPDEDELMKEVLRLSKGEYEASQRKNAEKDASFEKDIEVTLAESKDDVNLLEKVAEKKREEMKQVVTSSIADTKTELDTNTELPRNIEAASNTPSSEDTSNKPTTESPEPPPKQTESPKKQASPTKMPASPVKKPVSPTKTPASPIKQPASPIKKPASPIKKPLSPIKKSPVEPAIASALPPILTCKSESAQEAAASWLSSAKAEAETAGQSNKDGTRNIPSKTDDMKRREIYLRQQRDKLLAMKKQEREKRLDNYSASHPKRPSSARVARCAVTEEDTGKQESLSVTTDDPKKLAMRKALADRLKKEVVYK